MKKHWSICGFAVMVLSLFMTASVWAGTITPTVVTTGSPQVGMTKVVTWTALTSTNASGAPEDCRKYQTVRVQIKGTPGWNTGTLTIQGSDDGTNYVTLRALSTVTAISYTADPTTLIEIFEGSPNYIKPVLSGAGTDSITVTLTAKN